MPCALAGAVAGTLALTSAAVMIPEIVVGGAGHGCVPACPLPRFVHRNTVIPPLTPACPKWMWACCTAPSRSEYDSDHAIDVSSLLTLARNSPLAVLDTEGTSS